MNLEQRWPELFANLTPRRRHAVLLACAANWHEGWEPNRDDVTNLIDGLSGTITRDQYLGRSLIIAQRHSGTEPH
jgi:hypothetical protein